MENGNQGRIENKSEIKTSQKHDVIHPSDAINDVSVSRDDVALLRIQSKRNRRQPSYLARDYITDVFW